jgi:putative FmdB family regulatory protein
VPIYEYQCDKCEHKLEALQKMSDEPLKLCPECGKQSLRKLVSAVAFRLSGSGWYETDFKDKKEQKNLSKSDNKPASEGDNKKADKSGELKSATSASETSSVKKSTETKSSKKSTSDD